MATSKQKAATAAKAANGESKPRARIVTEVPDGPEGEEHEGDGDEQVMVNVAKGFRLTLDDGIMVQYHAGAQSMPAGHAEHWYSKAMGVTLAE